MKITSIRAREILDSRGNPTIEATVQSGGISASAAVPSGASTGIHEALELRDGDKKRYGGQGVLKACKNVTGKIAPALAGVDVAKQEKIDQIMLDLDGTENKSKLGANAILSVSLAAARLAAKTQKKPLFSYLAETYGYVPKSLPTPLFNVINGGKHADSGLDVQEFFIIPQKGRFSVRLQAGVEVNQALKSDLRKRGFSVGVGDEGGFAPKLKNTDAAFQEIERAVKNAGYKVGSDFRVGMDVASSVFYNPKAKKYESKFSNKSASSLEMIKIYKSLIARYPVEILEDGLAEDDFLGWKLLTQELGGRTAIVGDDLFVTNPQRLSLGITQKMANAIIIKVNQIGTLTETLATIKLGQQHGYKVIVSHRSGETTDDFIADLAVAVNADYIKAGAPCRGERLAKYNRLLAIEELL